MLYATACWESLAGNTDAAIAALTSAFELEPKSIELGEERRRSRRDPRASRLACLSGAGSPAGERAEASASPGSTPSRASLEGAYAFPRDSSSGVTR